MESWHSYPKIYALGHAAIESLFDGEVLVEEKIDGSQFSFGRFDGELRARSKGQQLIIDHPEKMFATAIEVVQALDLADGWTYRAEYLQKPKHNVLCYNRIPERHLMIFDINTGHEAYLGHGDKLREASRIGLESVPLIRLGHIADYSSFVGMLETESVLGGVTIEGVVVKNYSRFGRDGKALMGKFVSERFKEKHNKDWKDRHPQGKDIIQIISEQYRHPMRWHKAVIHLLERGELDGSPKDIGPLINEVKTDVYDECREEMASQLLQWAWPNIQRVITAGLAEWYKGELAKSQFATNNNGVGEEIT